MRLSETECGNLSLFIAHRVIQTRRENAKSHMVFMLFVEEKFTALQQQAGGSNVLSCRRAGLVANDKK